MTALKIILLTILTPPIIYFLGYVFGAGFSKGMWGVLEDKIIETSKNFKQKLIEHEQKKEK